MPTEVITPKHIYRWGELRSIFHYNFIRGFIRRKDGLAKAKYFINTLRCPTRLILLILTVLMSHALAVFILTSILEEYTRLIKEEIPLHIPKDTVINILKELEEATVKYEDDIFVFKWVIQPIVVATGPFYYPPFNMLLEAHQQQVKVAYRLIEIYKERLNIT